MSIQTKQKSTYLGDRQWEWSVWLVASTEQLDQIELVTYTLHPSFSKPVCEIRSRKGGFRLKSRGWGDFTIYIDIARKDGSHQQLSHDLKLGPLPVTHSLSATTADSIEEMTEQFPTEQVAPLLKVAAHLFHQVVERVAERLPASTIFISGGIADADAVHKLRTSLQRLNVCILSPDDIQTGVPFQTYIANLIGQANLVVFLISGRPSLWLSQEIETTKRFGKLIVPVLIGTESTLPESLRTYKHLRIEKLEHIADLAQKILTM